MKRIKRTGRNKTAVILVLAALVLLAMSIPVQGDDSTFGIQSSNGDLEWEIEDPTENRNEVFNGTEFYQIIEDEEFEEITLGINENQELEISSEGLGETADNFFRYLIKIDDKYILEPGNKLNYVTNGNEEIVVEEIKVGYLPVSENIDWNELEAITYDDDITFTVKE